MVARTTGAEQPVGSAIGAPSTSPSPPSSPSERATASTTAPTHARTASAGADASGGNPNREGSRRRCVNACHTPNDAAASASTYAADASTSAGSAWATSDQANRSCGSTSSVTSRRSSTSNPVNDSPDAARTSSNASARSRPLGVGVGGRLCRTASIATSGLLPRPEAASQPTTSSRSNCATPAATRAGRGNGPASRCGRRRHIDTTGRCTRASTATSARVSRPCAAVVSSVLMAGTLRGEPAKRDVPGDKEVYQGHHCDPDHPGRMVKPPPTSCGAAAAGGGCSGQNTTP